MISHKALIITHEMSPYTDLSEQSDWLRDLAIHLQKKGSEIRIFMPKFGLIKERKHRLHEVIRLSGLNITVGRNNNPLIIKVASLQTAKIQIYFMDNSDFFQRKQYFHDESEKFYEDNDERIIFFNKGSLELLIKLGWIPDTIHCQGWMSGLVPLYARTLYKNEPAVKNSKIIYTHHPESIKSKLGTDFDKKAHIKIQHEELSFLKEPMVSDMHKVAAYYSDHVVISSNECTKDAEKFFNQIDKPILDTRNLQGEDVYESYFNIIT